MNIRKTLLTTTLFFAGTATALLADNGKAIDSTKRAVSNRAKAMLLQNSPPVPETKPKPPITSAKSIRMPTNSTPQPITTASAKPLIRPT